MEPTDLEEYRDRYRRRLAEHGYSPKTLGWGDHGRQELRFSVLATEALARPESSVLDVGCGFADLHTYLTAQGWRGRYVGVDIVPELLEVAHSREPSLDLRELDITGDLGNLGTFDVVVSSGAFNARLNQDNCAHIGEALAAMRRLARVVVGVDFLSSHVDFEKPTAWHTDPAWAFGVAKTLARRVTLRHDYMPFEFALFLYVDDAVSERNVFRAHDSH